jgi:hypothetical protein
VLCAGSALLFAEDESTSIINGALVRVLLSQSASPSVIIVSPLLTDIKPWFLNSGKTSCYTHHTFLLGFPMGWVSTMHKDVCSHINYTPPTIFWRHQSVAAYFLAPLSGRKRILL